MISEEGIKVLSCFDGMSCGQIALNRANIKYSQYFASEIDKHAIQVTQHNYPNTIQLGDVTKVSGYDLPKIDLFFGGSPCQGFSLAGKMLNFDDPRSKLFFEYVRILNELREKNPSIKFLLENVRMKKWCQDVISRYLGVEPIMIDSNLVSAQNRERYYWTNIDFNTNIKDKGLVLRDILEKEVDEKYYLSDKMMKFLTDHTDKHKKAGNGFQFKPKNGTEKANTIRANAAFSATDNGILEKKVRQLNTCKESGGKQPYQQNRIYDIDSLSPALMAQLQDGSHKILEKKRSYIQLDPNNKGGKSQTDRIRFLNSESAALTASNCENKNKVVVGERIRKLTPIECERLQTVPDNYTNFASDSQRYKMLGNGWTVDVIAIIFQGLANKKENISRRVSLSLFDTPSVKPEALTLSL